MLLFSRFCQICHCKYNKINIYISGVFKFDIFLFLKFKFLEQCCQPWMINAWHTNPSLRDLWWLYGEHVSVCSLSVFFLLLTVFPSYPLPPHTNTLHYSVLHIHSMISLTLSLSHTHILKYLALSLPLCLLFFETRCSNPQGLSFSQREKKEAEKEQLRWEKKFHPILLLFSAQLLYKPHFVWFKECWEAWAADVRFCGK